MQSVTDVLTHGVTHVLTPNSKQRPYDRRGTAQDAALQNNGCPPEGGRYEGKGKGKIEIARGTPSQGWLMPFANLARG